MTDVDQHAYEALRQQSNVLELEYGDNEAAIREEQERLSFLFRRRDRLQRLMSTNSALRGRLGIQSDDSEEVVSESPFLGRDE